jgi:hypothetical protein
MVSTISIWRRTEALVQRAQADHQRSVVTSEQLIVEPGVMHNIA